MVFERSQRGFLLFKINFGTRCGQSLLLKFRNSLVLLRYALLAICDELKEQRTRRFVTRVCPEAACFSAAMSLQVSCGCVLRMAELSSSLTA